MLKQLNFCLTTLKGILNSIFLVLHTVFWCIPMYFFYFFKILSSNPKWLSIINPILIGTANNWIRTNNLMMDLTMSIKWELPDFKHLKLNQWYFIICNHQSWIDIMVLHRIFLKKIPFIRFFIKKELRWLPVLGLAWWAYDFPIMHRHTKQQIAKNPELRLKDFAATEKACRRYHHMPVTILNFLEGTRFTKEKKAKQHSPYQNLLEPKSGGFAFAINVMDQKITHILDVTIHYPQGAKSYWDYLCGRVKHIRVIMKEYEIPSHLQKGNYQEDEHYRKEFKDWIHSLWLEKDILLTALNNSPK